MSTVRESHLAALIGDGVMPSLTPPMHEVEAAHHGLRCIYRPVDLAVIGRPGADVGELLRAARDLGFNAANVTHPCKQLVLDWMAVGQAVDAFALMTGRPADARRMRAHFLDLVRAESAREAETSGEAAAGSEAAAGFEAAAGSEAAAGAEGAR